MSILERLERVRRVWELLIPDVPTPSDTWLAKWCAAFPDDVIEAALNATAKKFRNAPDASAEAVHRYTTATMRHRAEEAAQMRQTAPSRPAAESTLATQ